MGRWTAPKRVVLPVSGIKCVIKSQIKASNVEVKPSNTQFSESNGKVKVSKAEVKPSNLKVKTPNVAIKPSKSGSARQSPKVRHPTPRFASPQAKLGWLEPGSGRVGPREEPVHLPGVAQPEAKSPNAKI